MQGRNLYSDWLLKAIIIINYYNHFRFPHTISFLAHGSQWSAWVELLRCLPTKHSAHVAPENSGIHSQEASSYPPLYTQVVIQKKKERTAIVPTQKVLTIIFNIQPQIASLGFFHRVSDFLNLDLNLLLKKRKRSISAYFYAWPSHLNIILCNSYF